MVHVTYSKLIFNPLMKSKMSTKRLSKYIQRDICSKAIRQKFLDYFINEKTHNFVKSSPVVPFCDPTVAFVNAGMNQFKGIFLGTQSSEYTRVANSQKCIRVGGKHNDLNIVGTDGYHHTFFEMLGNWSFGDYFKPEACQMAWDLLTNVYKLPASRLYVTYFKGDKSLGLSCDTETKEIWRQIGVPDNRILPFGVNDNFWEMGLTGPCGPCTEIHIDHRGTTNRAQFVNKGLHDLTEIWNIVFIEYNRNADGSISSLPKKHVDTGLGFERLTSVLQGKISNYDTDNFTYLLNAIYKNCSNLPKYEGKFGENDWNNLDTSYRILADHMRMITASLADGIIPEQNQKLRRILRRSFLLSKNVFQREKGLVKELTNYVVEHLGPIYPEMEKNLGQIRQIIDYEEDVYKLIRKNADKEWQKLSKENPELLDMDLIEITPSFIAAYKDINSTNPSEINAKLAFKLYDTHGLDKETIIKLSELFKLKFNAKDLDAELEKAKLRSKDSNKVYEHKIMESVDAHLPKTDDSFKYSYYRKDNKYIFSDVEVKILSIIKDNNVVDKVGNDSYCSVLLDKTNLYSMAGGQSSDKGVINFNDGLFTVEELENINNYIWHKGFFRGKVLNVGNTGTLKLDEKIRLNNMSNHTSTHLLNAAIKKVKGATCQKSSRVTDVFLTFDVAIFGSKLNMNEIKGIEQLIFNVIENELPVNISEVNSQQLYSFDHITLVPGEVYPESGIRIIQIKSNDEFISREPCCGTHVYNTSDIEDFCIISLKSLGRSTASITAVTGDRAKLARQNANELLEEISLLEKNLNDNIDKPEVLDIAVLVLKQKLNYNIEDQSILPLHFKHECLEKLDMISKRIKEISRGNLKDFIEMEMQNALESNIKSTKSDKKYIVHYLRSSMILESVPLQRATRLCPDIPVLVVSYCDNMVRARCCVPKEFRNDNFNAEKWLKKTVTAVFKSKAAPPKGQDGTLVCNMKAKKVHLQEWDTLLNESINSAEKYIEENL